MVSSIITYLVAAMMVWCPLSAHRYSQSSAMTDEEKDAYTLTRYQAIAQDVAEVAFDADEKPIFKEPGVIGRLESALLALSIASYESGEFSEDVDTVKGTGESWSVPLSHADSFASRRGNERPQGLFSPGFFSYARIL